MIKEIAEMAEPILEFSFIRRTRRNHALEHATIHVLTGKLKNTSMAGRSSESGFVLMGNVPTEEVEKAAQEALDRLGKGESHLALHPNCGTNLVTAGVFTTIAGYLGLGAGKPRITPDRLSWTMMMMVIAIIASQPVGMKLQKYITTKDEPGDLELVGVTKREVRWPFFSRPITVHTVITRRG